MITDIKSRFYTVSQLGPKRFKTPEGYLVCVDVPICRTGMMLYGPNETPIEGIGNRPVKIYRMAEDVFHPDAISSANGKPVVDDHPRSGEVNLKSWSYLAKGMSMNAHRGEGTQDDLMLVDLVIFDEDMIQILDTDEKREVSCGYDADYIDTAPGEGKQVKIIINHVAVVDSGRCGTRCAIGDSLPKWQKGTRKRRMKVIDWKNKLVAALGGVDKVPAAANKVLDEMDPDAMLEDAATGRSVDNQIHIHNAHDYSGRLDDHERRIADCEAFMKKTGDNGLPGGLTAPPGTNDSEEEKKKEEERKKEEDKRMKDAESKEIEGELEEEAPEGTGDSEIKKANDSSLLGESFQATVAMAEIIAPGIKLPTMDSAAKPKTTLDSICDLRRRALAKGLEDADVAAMVTEVRGRALDSARLEKMHCRDVRHLFNSVGALVKASNTGSIPPPTLDTSTGQGGAKKLTVAEINKRNADYYSKH